ncbi:MAG: hypothetical protein EBY49_07195 [Actinobacteria bacterium]|nr:hypothetical protein [Actinomycetota bacterium]
MGLDDNPAWAAATEAHDEIVAVLVIEPALLDAAGPHRRRAFLTAAEALDRSITELGGRLHVRIGDPVRILPALTQEADAAAVSPITCGGVRHSLPRPPGIRPSAGLARLVRPHHPSVHRHRSAGNPSRVRRHRVADRPSLR